MNFYLKCFSFCAPLIFLTGCNQVVKTVFVDQYTPVLVQPIIESCPKPTYNVTTLDRVLLEDDLVYVQYHAADDIALFNYAKCNAEVIMSVNENAKKFNVDSLLDVPLEKRQGFIDKLPEPIKNSINSNK